VTVLNFTLASFSTLLSSTPSSLFACYRKRNITKVREHQRNFSPPPPTTYAGTGCGISPNLLKSHIELPTLYPWEPFNLLHKINSRAVLITWGWLHGCSCYHSKRKLLGFVSLPFLVSFPYLWSYSRRWPNSYITV